LKGAAKAIRTIGLALAVIIVIVIVAELYFMLNDFTSQNIALEPSLEEAACKFNGTVGVLEIPVKITYNGSHVLKDTSVVSLINTTESIFKFKSRLATLEAKSMKTFKLKVFIPIDKVREILRQNTTLYFGLSFFYDGIFGVEILTKTPLTFKPQVQLQHMLTSKSVNPGYKDVTLGFTVINTLPVPIEGKVYFLAQGSKLNYKVIKEIKARECHLTVITITFSALNEDLEKGMPYVLLLKIEPDVELVLNEGILKV